MLRFEARIVGKYVALYRVRPGDNFGSGPPTCFELADPNCWKQIFSYFARECVV